MKPKTLGPARTLGQFRENHEKKGHKVFDDGVQHTWRIYKCGGCTFRFYIEKAHAVNGADAIGEEWVWD